jgi:hypothetical protein
MDSTAKPPKTFTEADWNPISIKECEEKGRDAAPGDKYRGPLSLKIVVVLADGLNSQ